MDVSKLGTELLAKAAAATRTEVETSSAAAPGDAASFAKEMGASLSKVNQELNHAEASARELAAGKGDLVETMISLGRADLSLRMVVNLRNRMLESYNEIMRLQV